MEILGFITGGLVALIALLMFFISRILTVKNEEIEKLTKELLESKSEYLREINEGNEVRKKYADMLQKQITLTKDYNRVLDMLKSCN
jgi:hypothetical protein